MMKKRRVQIVSIDFSIVMNLNEVENNEKWFTF